MHLSEFKQRKGDREVLVGYRRQEPGCSDGKYAKF